MNGEFNFDNPQQEEKIEVKEIPSTNYTFKENKSKSLNMGKVIAIVVVVAIICSVFSFSLAFFGKELVYNIGSGLFDKAKQILDITDSTTKPDNTVRPNVTLGSSKGTIIDPDNPVVSIAENVGPCVVTINNKAIPTRGFNNTPQLQGSGSGVIVTEDGYIVTNNHVIEGADEITVVFINSNEEIKAELIGADARTDLALLKINKTGLTAIEFGKKDEIRVGELAVAIGNPLGESGSVTTGVVSAIDRIVNVDGVDLKFLQTDAAINPGNSGGALVNSRGQLIGINSMKRLSTVGENGEEITTEGIGYAIPIDVVEDIVGKLLQDGKVIRAGLGITGGFVYANEDENTPAGILIDSVNKGEAANNAGIEPGDLIYEYEGNQIESFQQMIDALSAHKVGDKINLTIMKSDKTSVEVRVTLTELKK